MLFLGEAFTGKTWLVSRIVYDSIPEIDHPTIGCEHNNMTIETKSGDNVRVTILDTGKIFFFIKQIDKY